MRTMPPTVADKPETVDELDNAMSVFLTAPSFSTKQKAIELLLRKVYLDAGQRDVRTPAAAA